MSPDLIQPSVVTLPFNVAAPKPSEPLQTTAMHSTIPISTALPSKSSQSRWAYAAVMLPYISSLFCRAPTSSGLTVNPLTIHPKTVNS